MSRLFFPITQPSTSTDTGSLLSVTPNLPGPNSVTRSTHAQLRRLERATGKQERKRLRKRLAQQSTPSASSTQPQASTASAGNLTIQQQLTSTATEGNLPLLLSIPRAIGSCRLIPPQFAHFFCGLQALSVLPVLLIHFNTDLARCEWRPVVRMDVSKAVALEPTRCCGRLLALSRASDACAPSTVQCLLS